jgi:hypothetical protein
LILKLKKGGEEMEEFVELKEKFVAIRAAIADLIEKINKEAKGEPFAIRIFLTPALNGENPRIIGYIKDLRVDGCNLLFTLKEQRVIKNKIREKEIPIQVPLDGIEKIEIFRTKSGKPIIL